MSSFGVVCADGIGDALITSIATHHLKKEGHDVTTFSSHLNKFGKYVETGKYLPITQNWKEILFSFDAVLLQCDDTKRSKEILSLRKEGLNLYVIYTNYRLSKHGPLLEGHDYPVDEDKPMVHNVCLAMQALFGIQAKTQNCLAKELPLTHRKFDKRILIHPTSTREDKNWLKSRFLKLARKLEKKGFEPVFIVDPKERHHFPNAPIVPTLEDLTTLVYESGYLIGNDSGPVHLASYYQIPHLVICQGRQMPLWSPGWLPPRLILPPRWIPNLKGMRLRENKWQHFITTRLVIKELFSLSLPSVLDKKIHHREHREHREKEG